MQVTETIYRLAYEKQENYWLPRPSRFSPGPLQGLKLCFCSPPWTPLGQLRRWDQEHHLPPTPVPVKTEAFLRAQNKAQAPPNGS